MVVDVLVKTGANVDVAQKVGFSNQHLPNSLTKTFYCYEGCLSNYNDLVVKTQLSKEFPYIRLSYKLLTFFDGQQLQVVI